MIYDYWPSDHVQIVFPFKIFLYVTSLLFLPVKTTFTESISGENILCNDSLYKVKRKSIVNESKRCAKCQITGVRSIEQRHTPDLRPIQKASKTAHGEQFEQDA